MRIDPIRILLQKARSDHCAQRCAISAEAGLARYDSIVLIATFARSTYLLLPMGKESRARHRWSWLRAMSAWWICSQSIVAHRMM